MKRICLTVICLNAYLCLHAQGITLLYKNDLGWDNAASWIQINTPGGQMPIQRVPTADDDVVISQSMSGISSVSFETDNVDPDFNIGGSSPNGPARCKSVHVSNTQISFDNPSLIDAAPTINVYTSNGGFVLIDSGANMLHGHFELHGGSPEITDLQILHSTYGVLFSHANWTGIGWDTGARLRFVGSKLGGFGFTGSANADVYIDSCTIETTHFSIGDSSSATLTNSNITNNGTNVSMTFFIGKNSNFVSASDTLHSYGPLNFTTSGSQLNGNVAACSIPSDLYFLQEDPANPLPNIINGNLSAGELSTSMGISGDLKISGNISGWADDNTYMPPAVLVNGQAVFTIGGIRNYRSGTSINNCVQDFCHYQLEFFGNTDSRITWNGGFPIDTLVINKTGCAKVSFDSSLYVSGAARIKSGQLVLDPNDNHPYKFVCAGNVDIAQGGGLFLRRDVAGVTANIAVAGTLTDHNVTTDSTCEGLSNPYNGLITFYTALLPVTLLDFTGRYADNDITLNWSTEAEIDTKYFTIEKSADQYSFMPLADINALGNAQKHVYRYTDRSSLNGINYYRLKMADADGRYTYSKIIAVAAAVKKTFTIFPNPIKDALFIRLTTMRTPTEIFISDAKETVIKQVQLRAGAVETSIIIASLPAGVYAVTIQNSNQKSTQQFIKE